VDDADGLRNEVDSLRTLERTVREQLYSIESAGVRAIAVSALAAASAERAHARSEALPEWCNETSNLWRRHLADVWRYLEGDSGRHYALSNALAGFLTSPLNHNEGQDGPDDFDRPQTIASYSAVASVIFWGVDFATVAVGQVFELIDLEYNGEFTPERAAEVDGVRQWALDACVAVVRAASTGRAGLPAVLAELRQ